MAWFRRKITFAVAVVAALALLFLTVAVSDFPERQQLAEGNALVTLHPEKGNPLIIKAEIADTQEKIRTGLMFRQSLGSNGGMLFVFPNSAVRNFWMKNTLIPLDMVFITENMTIVKIRHAVPCKGEPCPLYNSQQPVRYVLEVNSNLTTAYGISEGSKVKIELD